MEMPRLRAVIAVIAGAVFGTCISSGFVVLWAIFTFRERHLKYMFEEAPPLELSTDALVGLLVPPIAGGLNGTLGAMDGLTSNNHSPWRVVPGLAMLLILPLYELLQTPRDSQGVTIALIAAIFIGGFVWISGRLGQRIGIAGRSRKSDSLQAPER
jgi:hypothetical protein